MKLIVTWSKNVVISEDNRKTAFALTDIKLYIHVATLSTQDNTKLLQQLKSGFKRTIKWNKYQPKVSIELLKEYLHYLIDLSLQGVNILFALSSENNAHRTGHTGYFLPEVEIKDYNFMIDEQNLFDQPVKIDLRTYAIIQKTATSRGDDYTSSCLLDYPYFKEYYNLVSSDLSKQQAPDTIQKQYKKLVLQQI